MSSVGVFFAPFFLVPDHGVEDGQQFPHRGDQGDHLLLAGGDQPLVVSADHGVVLGGDEGRHVEGMTDRRPSAEGGAFATHRARVAVDRRDADEGRDLLA
mgnify:CR=1 FL=1